MQEKTYGFIGLGNMGRPMAARLIEAGYPLIVADLDQTAVDTVVARGARAATGPKEVSDAADVVFLSLPDGAVVDAVTRDLHEGSRVRCVVDLSTVGPAAAQRAARLLAQRGIEYIDAPISGGPSGAERGTLAVMVACSPAAYEGLQAPLQVFGKLFYMGGEPGQAQIMKLANNLLSATAVVVTGEALALGVKAGLDPAVMLDVINAGSGRNSATMDKYPKAVLTGTYSIDFAVRLAHKDVRLCLDEAQQRHVPMFVGSAVREMLAATIAVQGKDADYAEVARVFEQWAGVSLQAKPGPGEA
ncbi:NAD(P)-dependent oxidoreductase [Alcaligenaceae bacterium]|nr:NAD(P)-dependent oxidoreductase [Alcaligenaceae bacterium]